MCDGDHKAAAELAIGPAQRPGEPLQKDLHERMADRLSDYEEPSEKELEAIGREIDERRDRVRRHVLAETSYDYCIAAGRWLEKHDKAARLLHECARAALEIIHWDLFLIHVKITRALTGRDEDPKGRIWKSRVQNDWNGSAKVALISIDRSERAWRDLALTLPDEAATVLADSLAHLRDAIGQEFPAAARFRRPGFDDPVCGGANRRPRRP
jgi:hypothetical protein